MKKLILSAVAVASLAGSAYTLSAFAAPDNSDERGMHRMGDAGFLLDAKLAGMKAALNLTADQDKLWTPFETAVRDVRKDRMEGMRQRREREDSDEGERPSPIAVMNQMSERLAKASESLKKVAEAAKPLYDGLDDGQKRHFGPLLRMLRERDGHG